MPRAPGHPMWLNRLLAAYAWVLGLLVWAILCAVIMLYGSGG